jgi:apolipoprotein N-acyltransferase
VLGRVGRWISEQFAFLLVLAVLAAAFGYLTIDPTHWSRVAGVVAVALLLAGGVRLTLPTERSACSPSAAGSPTPSASSSSVW